MQCVEVVQVRLSCMEMARSLLNSKQDLREGEEPCSRNIGIFDLGLINLNSVACQGNPGATVLHGNGQESL